MKGNRVLPGQHRQASRARAWPDRPAQRNQSVGEVERRHDHRVALRRRLDRLARKLGSQITWIERLESRGRQVVSVTEPDVGQDEMRVFVRQVMGAVAEYERATICRRMRDGRKAKAERGGYAYGSPAFGYRAENAALVADEAEQVAVTRIAELHAAGASLRAIAATLTTEGIRPKRGAKWYPATVARVLARVAS
jgi:DNA invertase Pin-like site-specific DNA recombinase